MAEGFLTLVNRGLSAGWLVLAVVAARFLLKKAPRWAVCALWGLVALRLLCPFSPESPLSLIPDAQPVSPEAVWNTVPAVEMAPDATEAPVSPVLEAVLPDGLPVSPTPAQEIVAAASILWCAGLAGMALYTLVSYRRLSRRVKGAVRIDGNLYQGAAIPTPFVLGVLRPRIYLPNTLSREDMPYVIAHERAHIRRRDPLWKALGFGLLCIYWFQPLLWLGYALFCRDMELACDEKVASALSPSHRANYSQALLNCSAGRRFLAACPVAFGEVGVKERVKRVLSFRRPTLRAVLAAVLICAVIAVCFLTNPVTPEPPKVTVAQMSITAEDVTPTGMTLTYHPDNAFQDVDAVTDSIYWLEKQNASGGWQVVQPNQWIEPVLQPVEAPGQRTIHVVVTDNNHRTLDWPLLGYLDAGQYRVGIHFWEEAQEYTLYAPFTLDNPLVTPYAITSSLKKAGSHAMLKGDNARALTQAQTEELVGILNSLTEADFYASGFINTPITVVSLVSGEVTMRLRYDGDNEVQLQLDSHSAEALSDTRWCIFNDGLNAFFEKLRQEEAG